MMKNICHRDDINAPVWNFGEIANAVTIENKVQIVKGQHIGCRDIRDKLLEW